MSRYDTIIISVVVCTLNRSQLLRNCLESLASQNLAIKHFEVIVVDNGSTDDTAAVIKEYIFSQKNFRGFKEDHQGLSYARNRGWKEAIGHYVAFIDDDAEATTDWVARIKAFIERCPQIPAFGGPYESFSLVTVPRWFPPTYGSWSLGTEERPVSIGKEWINGTNMIFKKEVLSELGGFNSNLGMSGRSISYGEETRLLLELKSKSMPVYYVPDIRVRHLLSAYKMRLSWLLSASYKLGKCSALTFGVKRSLFSHLSGIGACVLAGVSRIFCSGAEPFKRSVYVSFSPLFIELGAFVEKVSTRMRK